ncbi:MAG: TonB-dependent receptor [Alphaproteobacteria bacterium]|nr:MAG: TonB-dependent receptor [Alphaproteobacteria bacterium]
MLGYSALAGIVLATSGTAFAQAEGEAVKPANMLEEITVTAQKRSQNLQDVGIAISAFSGGMLDKMGVTQSSEVADLVPGVHISGNLAGQNTQFTIRGVTQNDFNDIVESPNAVYLDEGYIAIAQAQSFATFDIDRVEILKGPQGTLFGRNATGGLIHYVSRQPTFDAFGGYLDVTYGLFDTPANADGVDLTGAVNVPFSDKAAARFAVKYRKYDGFLKNNYPAGQFGGSPGEGAGANLGSDDTFSARATFLFEPKDTLSIRLSGNYSTSTLGTGPYQSKPTIAVFEKIDGVEELTNVIDVAAGETRLTIGSDGEDLGSDLDNNGKFGIGDNDPADAFLTSRFGAGTDFFGYLDPDGADFTTSSDFAFEDHGTIDTYGVNLNIGWDLNDTMTLTAISDFKSYEKLLFIDVDAAPVNQSANYAGVDATSFTQEIRVNGEGDKTRWVVGAFYLNIDNDADNGLKFPVGSVVPGAPYDLGSDAKLKTNSYSAFGQVEYDVTDQLTLIAGLRVISEKKDYEFSQNIYPTQSSFEIHQGDPFQIGPIYPGGVPSTFFGNTSDTLWAGNLRVEYRPNDDLLVFASLKRGVKAGSFNAQLAGGLPVPDLEQAIPYDEEVLYSYEAGFKKSFADGRARFNANVFYYDYNDYQAFLFTGVSGIVVNADARYIGADFELQATPFPGLLTQISGSWIDAVVKDVPMRIGGPIVRDVDPTYTPKFQFSGLVRYEWDAFGGLMSVLADASWSDSFFYNLRNFDADQFDSYFMMNARLGWSNADDTFEVALQARNLTDVRAGTQGFDLATLCGCNEVAYRAPRWFGINVKYTFE